jgi:hypothetical protein
MFSLVVDGIHLQARLEDEKQCILVLIGATPEGRKELVGYLLTAPHRFSRVVRQFGNSCHISPFFRIWLRARAACAIKAHPTVSGAFASFVRNLAPLSDCPAGSRTIPRPG